MRKIYLDQNIISGFSRVNDWRIEDDFGVVIGKALSQGSAEVWISPTHFLELTQLAEVEYVDNGEIKFIPSEKDARRQNLAKIILELSEGRRILPGIDAQLSYEFAFFVNELSEADVANIFLLEEIVRRQRVDFLGGLALMASLPAYLSPAVFEHVRTAKVQSQLIHARAAQDPQKFVSSVVEAVYENKNVADNIHDDFDKLGIAGCEKVISEIEAELKKNPKKWTDKSRRDWKREKHNIVLCYAIDSIARYLSSTLKFPWERMFSFDCHAMGKGWPTIEKKLGKLPLTPPLPDSSAALASKMNYFDIQREFTNKLLSGLKQGVLNGKFELENLKINTAHIEMGIVVNQLELALSSGQIPTSGLVLDSNHATAIGECTVFVTKDAAFREALSRVRNSLRMKFDICTDRRQLSKALGIS